jgi:hypothetical protein
VRAACDAARGAPLLRQYATVISSFTDVTSGAAHAASIASSCSAHELTPRRARRSRPTPGRCPRTFASSFRWVVGLRESSVRTSEPASEARPNGCGKDEERVSAIRRKTQRIGGSADADSDRGWNDAAHGRIGDRFHRLGRGRWLRLGNGPRWSREEDAQREGARALRGLRPAKALPPVSMHGFAFSGLVVGCPLPIGVPTRTMLRARGRSMRA